MRKIIATIGIIFLSTILTACVEQCEKNKSEIYGVWQRYINGNLSNMQFFELRENNVFISQNGRRMNFTIENNVIILPINPIFQLSGVVANINIEENKIYWQDYTQVIFRRNLN